MLFGSTIFFLQLLLAVAVGRRPAWCRVLPLNHLKAPHTNHKGRWISQRSQYASYGWSENKQPLVTCPRFEHSAFAVRAEQLNHSDIATLTRVLWTQSRIPKNLVCLALWNNRDCSESLAGHPPLSRKSLILIQELAFTKSNLSATYLCVLVDHKLD
jgi:hypothetical protein